MTLTPETDIHASAFFLADHAAVENGKVYVNGGFVNRLGLPALPATVSIAVVAVLHVPWRAYHQRHKFAIGVVDADENRLPLRIEGEFQVGAGPDMKVGEPTIMPVSAVINALPLDGPGTFSFTLEVDGTKIARWPVYVVQVVVPGLPPGGFGPPGPASIPPVPQA
jgi:hypothetical protein